MIFVAESQAARKGSTLDAISRCRAVIHRYLAD